MNLKYYYWFFKSAIPAEVCDQILEMGLTTLHDIKEQYGENALSGSTGGWKEKREGQDGIPVNHKTIEGLRKSGASLNNTYVRDSHVAFINHPSLYELVWPFVKEANAKAGWNWDWDYTEDFQFTKYSPGQFYGWHTDSGIEEYQAFDPMLHPYHKNPDGTMLIDQTGNPMPEDQHMTVNQKMVGKIRKLSVTISLNDHKDYKGGNLRFDLGPHRPDRYHTCKEIGSKGSVVVFPSFVHHQVTPVTSGTRYSLVAWNLGAPYK